MSQTLTNFVYHLTFSTKNRERYIEQKLEDMLFPYIIGIINSEKGNVISINGTLDHIHILCGLPPKEGISYYLKHIKGSSSKFIHENGYDYFSWQRGYGGFTVSESQVDIVKKYIDNQKEHHKRISFMDEYRILLKKNNISFDEKYLWD